MAEHRTGVSPKPDSASEPLTSIPGYAAARGLLGKAIRVRREKAKLTQAQAAELLGVSERTLRRWEMGEGELWTGGPDGTVDHEMMGKLKAAYHAVWSELPRNQYASAPLDPELRRRHFIRRNARIQHHDPDVAEAEIMGREPQSAAKAGAK